MNRIPTSETMAWLCEWKIGNCRLMSCGFAGCRMALKCLYGSQMASFVFRNLRSFARLEDYLLRNVTSVGGCEEIAWWIANINNSFVQTRLQSSIQTAPQNRLKTSFSTLDLSQIICIKKTIERRVKSSEESPLFRLLHRCLRKPRATSSFHFSLFHSLSIDR